MTSSTKVQRSGGHPWDNRPGFDLLFIDADTQSEMDSVVKNAESKFWQRWLIGVADDIGKPSGVMYKPCGAKTLWHDEPTNPHPGNRVFGEARDKVLEVAASLGIVVEDDKVQLAIEAREGPKTNVIIGKVLAVDDALGLVFQSIGQGKGVVLPAETLSRPVVVGNIEVISYVDGKGTVSDRTVRQERGRE